MIFIYFLFNYFLLNYFNEILLQVKKLTGKQIDKLIQSFDYKTKSQISKKNEVSI